MGGKLYNLPQSNLQHVPTKCTSIIEVRSSSKQLFSYLSERKRGMDLNKIASLIMDQQT